MSNFLTLLDNFFNTGTGFLFGPIIPNLFSLIIFAGLIAKDTKDYIDPLHK